MELSTWLAGTDALTALDAAHRAAWSAVDDDLLAMCRDRMAMLLGHEPTLRTIDDDRLQLLRSWSADGTLDERTRAALEFTEQYIVDVASMSDVQVASLRGHLGDQGLVDFVNALLVVEQRMTLERGLTAVLNDEAATPEASNVGTESARDAAMSRTEVPSTRSRRIATGARASQDLVGALMRFAAAAVRNDAVDPVTTELVRLRCATYHDCHT